ncbi:MAG: hypothetical protein RSF13_03120 [Clostridiales bacterium]
MKQNAVTQLTSLIGAEIGRRDLPKAEIYPIFGKAHATYYHKMANPGEIKVAELERLAKKFKLKLIIKFEE